ncbi:transcriptional regulator [Flavobacterium sp. Sd200]|uniref:transcriptional regulator n=1 Tax=Flavobacterium sp. Sd200 TaxID=2692211 RepID=UPI00136D71AB|nr:transcriptional regulator [Flavobacterium sp. Sd200]MXN91696.1 transcriptional regulator [Flavobacterium sp. Sd200]
MNNVNSEICKFLYNHWIKSYKSQRSFAVDHNIEENIVRKIKASALKIKDYNIPVKTLAKICEAKNIKLSDFFKEVDL